MIREYNADIKYQNKKLKDDISKVASKYENIKQKIRDQTRLVDKIRNNSHKRYQSRSASKHRDKEYLGKNQFGSFLEKFHFTVDEMIRLLEDGYKRDNKLMHNLLESQKHPNGKYVTVKPEVHDGLKRMIYE